MNHDSATRHDSAAQNILVSLSDLSHFITTTPPQDVDVLAFEFFVSVLRLLLGLPEVCSPITKATDKNYNVRDDFKDGNEGFKDPGR